MIEWVPWIVAAMIFYDLSLHIDNVYWNLKKKHFHPLVPFGFMYVGKKKEYSWKRFQIFWISYWGVGFLLMLTYLIWH